MMKSILALLFTLMASASAFAPLMQQTAGTYLSFYKKNFEQNPSKIITTEERNYCCDRWLL